MFSFLLVGFDKYPLVLAENPRSHQFYVPLDSPKVVSPLAASSAIISSSIRSPISKQLRAISIGTHFHWSLANAIINIIISFTSLHHYPLSHPNYFQITKFNYQVQLPYGLTCSQCVMQWTYYTGDPVIIIIVHCVVAVITKIFLLRVSFGFQWRTLWSVAITITNNTNDMLQDILVDLVKTEQREW